jgi:hypothetical protein
MGHYNSSVTRVAPVFDALLSADATGALWLDGLIALGSRGREVKPPAVGQRLISGHGPRWGTDESSLSAPLSLLEHLVRTITTDQVEASGDTGDILRQRASLALRDPSVVSAALEALRAGNRGRDWFVLEGHSRPDALLETADTVIVLEGKRTERSCTSKTKWMGNRSQLIRHMDAAMEAYSSKRILGLLIVEGDGGRDAVMPTAHWLGESAMQTEHAMLDASLPHRSSTERSGIASNVLGVTTWQAVCAANRIPWPPYRDVV